MYIHTMPAKSDFSTIEHCLCFNLRSASRAMTRFFDSQVRRLSIRPTQTPILGALEAKDGWTMAELSGRLGMDRTTLLRNLRPLQRDGLVRAKRRARDGHVQLAITQKGRAALAELLPAWRAAQDRVVAILGEERWTGIVRDLQAVATKLQA